MKHLKITLKTPDYKYKKVYHKKQMTKGKTAETWMHITHAILWLLVNTFTEQFSFHSTFSPRVSCAHIISAHVYVYEYDIVICCGKSGLMFFIVESVLYMHYTGYNIYTIRQKRVTPIQLISFIFFCV